MAIIGGNKIQNLGFTELIKKVIAEKKFVEPPARLFPMSQMEALGLVRNLIATALEKEQYIYDPAGIIQINFFEPLDWFQVLDSGEKMYEFVREYFLNEEKIESADFSSQRTGVSNGWIRLNMNKPKRIKK